MCFCLFGIITSALAECSLVLDPHWSIWASPGKLFIIVTEVCLGALLAGKKRGTVFHCMLSSVEGFYFRLHQAPYLDKDETEMEEIRGIFFPLQGKLKAPGNILGSTEGDSWYNCKRFWR